jgi:hypothetical protein
MVTENRLNKDPACGPNHLLASLGTNLRTTRFYGEEGPSLREKREGWGPLASRATSTSTKTDFYSIIGSFSAPQLFAILDPEKAKWRRRLLSGGFSPASM